MKLTDEQVDRFARAWKADFGEELPHETARLELGRLLFFFDLIARAFHGAPKRPDDDLSERDTMVP